MSHRSGFFNARMVAGNPDRRYNAEDYRDCLAVVISNGVLRSSADDLKVTASGMACTVGVGWGFINGGFHHTISPEHLAAVTAPVAGDRWDRVFLRFDGTMGGRDIYVVYVQGTAANDPVKPEPVRSGDIYDLVLADVFVAANASAVVVTDTRADANLCGWVYSTAGDGSFFTSLDNQFEEWFEDKKDTLASVTLFKRYEDEIELESRRRSVPFNIPQYDPNTCFAEVFVNGLLDEKNTVLADRVKFNVALDAGTFVTVRVYKSIDGTGITSVSDEITELQNQMQTVIGESKFVFQCSGVDDNVSISQIAQAILDGTYEPDEVSEAAAAFLERIGGAAYLSALSENAQVTIGVSGLPGITSAVSGSGVELDPYHWFNLGKLASTDRKVIFDFAKCEKIAISVGAGYHEIFYGNDLHVKNANVDVLGSSAGTNVTVFGEASGDGSVSVFDSSFAVDTTGNATGARNGDFAACKWSLTSSGGNALVFVGKSGSVITSRSTRATAHVVSGAASAIVYIGAGDPEAVVFADQVIAPTVEKSGFVQNDLVSAAAGHAILNSAVSLLTVSGSGATVNGLVEL